MTMLKQLLQKTHHNLQILRECEAKYGGNAPLELLNQIDDHMKAIELTEQAIAGELSEAEWREAMQPLLVAIESRSAGEASSSVTIGDIEGGIHNSIVAGRDVIQNITYVQSTSQPKVEEKPLLSFEPETILIPAGSFIMGSDTGEAIEKHQHTLILPAFKIGKYPVTNEQYAEYVQQTGAVVSAKAGWVLAKVGQAPPPDKLKHPVVGVSWDEAVAYCRWLSEQTGRAYDLPTEAEWEKAARGPDDDRLYPWAMSGLRDDVITKGSRRRRLTDLSRRAFTVVMTWWATSGNGLGPCGAMSGLSRILPILILTQIGLTAATIHRRTKPFIESTEFAGAALSNPMADAVIRGFPESQLQIPKRNSGRASGRRGASRRRGRRAAA